MRGTDVRNEVADVPICRKTKIANEHLGYCMRIECVKRLDLGDRNKS
jgi:hypothetical protein